MNRHCLFWVSLLSTTLSLVHSEDIVINPWELPSVNAPYGDIDVVVGDTMTFVWAETQTHAVFINPSGNCTDTDNVLVASTSPAVYTFTEADVTRSPLFFADNTNELCENGMGFSVNVTQGVVPTAPVAAPVANAAPAAAPVDATDTPTAPPPVAAPTFPPTTPPVPAPTVPPVAPTLPPVAPTEPPVAPTEVPIAIIPTEPPVIPTDMPTLMPIDTSLPSEAVIPTLKPTFAQTQPGGTVETIMGLKIGLAGITTFPQSTQAVWEQTTKEFSESFIMNDLGESVSNFATTYTVTDVSVAPINGQRNLLRGAQFTRQLQQQAVIIVFDQTMQYDTLDSSIDGISMAQLPFDTREGKQAYVTLLKSTGDPQLVQVGGVSSVVPPPVDGPTSGTGGGGGDDPVLSTPAIIGIACGGGALLILIVLYFLYCRGGSRKGSKEMSKAGDDEPPLHVNVRDDEVSTLAGPTGPPTYGDQRYAKGRLC